MQNANDLPSDGFDFAATSFSLIAATTRTNPQVANPAVSNGEVLRLT